MGTRLEEFSRDYLIAPNVTVETYDEADAIMDADLFEDLTLQAGVEPLGYIDGVHYEFLPRESIPHYTVAVPRSKHRGIDGPLELLIHR